MWFELGPRRAQGQISGEVALQLVGSLSPTRYMAGCVAGSVLLALASACAVDGLYRPRWMSAGPLVSCVPM